MSKILIVEDNEKNLYLMKFILEKNGHETISAVNGEDGVAAATQGEADIVLMDIQLPDIDGLQAVRRIRASGSDVPIIAVTSYAMAGDREKALDAGCNGYITKPINPRTIIAEVEKYL